VTVSSWPWAAQRLGGERGGQAAAGAPDGYEGPAVPGVPGVRLNPEELAAVKAVVTRDGLSLPGALRQGFLRYAAEAG
jgi:hypothetical protein